MFFKLISFSLFCGVLLKLIPFSIQDDAPVIQLLSGKIKGEDKESRDDKDFFAYRGIPYATANRFEAPQRPKNWSDVRDAKDYGKKCIQYSTFEKKVVGSEDCLFINVFSPKIGDGLSKKLLPVMVFIHGNFMDGTSEIYRAHYFMDEEVVVVTFNFRLNIFGFLSTADDIVPGNMGLKDQIMALQFVQENIRKFSGDPNRVTIFGAGDGASSVHLLMLSPLSKGLFRKAITQSGSALKLSVIQKNSKQAAARIAGVMNCGKVLNEKGNATKSSEVNCVNNNSSLILECLKLVDAKKLAEVQKDGFELFHDPLTFFGPVIEFHSKDSKEQAFLTEHPYSIISSGKQSKVPWMTGISAQEGLILSGVILNDKSLMENIEANWPQLSARLLKHDPSRSDITKSIRQFYLTDGKYKTDPFPAPAVNLTAAEVTFSPTLYPILQPVSISLPTNVSIPGTTPSPDEEELPTIRFEEQFDQFTDLFTDRLYAKGMFDAIQMQSKYSSIYVYYNDYKGQYSLVDVYTGKSKEPTPSLKKASNWFKKNILGKTPPAPKHLGVCNGDELPLLFKYPDLKIKENTKDYEMSKLLVKLWVQFATDETKMTYKGTPWLPSTQDDLKWMIFGNTDQESGFGPISDTFMNRMKYWSTLKYLAPFDQ